MLDTFVKTQRANMKLAFWLTRLTSAVPVPVLVNFHITATGTHALFAWLFVTDTDPPASEYVSVQPPAQTLPAINAIARTPINRFIRLPPYLPR